MPGKDRRTTASAAPRSAPRLAVVLGGALAALFLLPPPTGATATVGTAPAGDCLRCHADRAASRQITGDGRAAPQLDLGMLADSSHRDLACVECHQELAGKDVARGHPALPRPAAGSAEQSQRAREVCGRCHAGHEVEADLGRRAPRAPGFRPGFHGLATRGRTPVLADCTSCHQPHAILPAGDPRNPIGRTNLAASCGRSGCHEATGTLERGEVHGGLTPARRELLSVVRVTYILTILATALAMLLHNALHFLGRRRVRRTVHG